jgi:hypothetical protein
MLKSAALQAGVLALPETKSPDLLAYNNTALFVRHPTANSEYSHTQA